MLRSKHYNNITLHLLYFHLNIIMSTIIMYQHNYKYALFKACIMYHLIYIVLW